MNHKHRYPARLNAPGLIAELIKMGLVLLLAVPAARPRQLFAQDNKVLLNQDSFSSESPGWETYAQRPEISPEFSVDSNKSLSGKGSLCIYGASNAAVRGCWRKVVDGVEGGAFYKLSAAFSADGVAMTHFTVFARIEWRDSQGRMIGHTREYALEKEVTAGGWHLVEARRQAPDNAVAVALELFLSQEPQGRVWWDAVKFARIPAPPHRKVRLATVNCRPGGNSSVAETVAEFCEVAAMAGEQHADIVCLGEGVNLIGVAQPDGRASTYSDIAEPIPGPTTRQLGEVAKKYNMYIVAALGEREDQAIYNTAVLIGRDGEVKGKYRKVHLPEGEYDQGCAHGSSYPVWDVDFGRIGIMICWDSWFVDPARALAAAGAEIILVPIWGGNRTLLAARAIENHVYVADCGYDVESLIFGPWGKLLAEPKERPSVGWTDIDLNYLPKCPWPWPLSDTRQVLMQGSRYDIRIPELER